MRKNSSAACRMCLIAVVVSISLWGSSAGAAAPDLLPVTIKPTPNHPPLVLVADGKPQATLCLMAGADGAAAKELQTCIRQATGAAVPILRGKVPEGPAVVLGDCAEAQAAGLVGSKMPIEGFAIKTAPNRVFIVGNEGGTAWGTYEFAERVVGARWYWPPQAGGRTVPTTKTLEVEAMWIEDAPVFRMRTIWPTFGGSGPNGELRTLHDALRAGNSWPVVLQVHAPHGWGKLYGAEHPEVMQKRKDGSRDDKMLCYGNPKTLALHLEVLARAFDKGEKLAPGDIAIRGKAITVSPWDAGIACYCEDCQAMLDKGAGGLATASRLMGTFVAKLGQEVKKRWPDKTIIYLPYVNYTLAPEGIDFPDNVEVQLCGMAGLARYKEPATMKRYQDNIDTWRKLTNRKVQTWDYSCWPEDSTRSPFLYPHVIKDYYQANREKIIGTFINGTTDHWPRSHLSLYAWLKCLWNPGFNVDAALDEFAARMFGPAAKPMRELVQLQCDGWEKSRWPDGHYSAKAVYEHSYPKATMETMQALLTEARTLIGDDPLLKQRLDYYEAPFADFYEEYAIVIEGKGVRPLVAKKVAENPTVDGKLDEALWDVATPTAFRRHVKEGKDTEPRHPTWVKAVWTADAVSFAFRCSESSPDKLVMDNANRDDGTLWFQDCVELFLDPSGKGGGKVAQLLLTAGGGIFDAWNGDAGWSCEGLTFAKALGKDHWTMEVTVPLKALPEHMQPATGVVWNGQFTRHRPGKGKKDPGGEAQKMNAKYGGFNSNTADFAPIRFEE